MATFLHVYTYKAISCCWLLLLVFWKEEAHSSTHTALHCVYKYISSILCVWQISQGGREAPAAHEISLFKSPTGNAFVGVSLIPKMIPHTLDHNQPLHSSRPIGKEMISGLDQSKNSSPAYWENIPRRAIFVSTSRLTLTNNHSVS